MMMGKSRVMVVQQEGWSVVTRKLVNRIFVYLIGVILICLGIVLCKNCGLGISPISSVPYALSYVAPLSFGTLTALFHFANTGVQMALSKSICDAKLWLQVGIAFVFGIIIDLAAFIIPATGGRLSLQVLYLVLSVVVTALGMVLMLGMDIVQNPPDGTVKLLSIKSGRELGRVKVAYDVACVCISLAIGVVLHGKPVGFGIATIISAIFVGRCVMWIKQLMQRAARRIMVLYMVP